MSQAKIRRRKQTIEKHLGRWEAELLSLREICLHPNPNVKYGSNTGNYDPSADSHWKDFKCEDCGKFWREEQ